MKKLKTLLAFGVFASILTFTGFPSRTESALVEVADWPSFIMVYTSKYYSDGGHKKVKATQTNRLAYINPDDWEFEILALNTLPQVVGQKGKYKHANGITTKENYDALSKQTTRSVSIDFKREIPGREGSPYYVFDLINLPDVKTDDYTFKNNAEGLKDEPLKILTREYIDDRIDVNQCATPEENKPITCAIVKRNAKLQVVYIDKIYLPIDIKEWEDDELVYHRETNKIKFGRE